MGLFDRKRTIEAVAPMRGADVAAQIGPAPTLDAFYPFGGADYLATREEAMGVPAIARARNMICNSIATIPLITRDKTTGQVIDQPVVISEPDKRVPGAVSWCWAAEDLLFTGFSYFQVMSLFADTGRVREMWRVAPNRVGVFLNDKGTQIEYYTVDGMQVPNGSVVGGLVVFYGNDEGLLNRAGKTIRTGSELERAAAMYAREPVPSMVLKSNGTALPADRIAKLLDAWGAARRNRGTAFLNADVELTTVGFTPEQIGLNAAREIIATELARAVGIPAYFIDAPTGSSMTYANASTARQTLLDFSLLPLMNSISSRLSMPDFTPSTQRVEFDLKAYLRGSEKERAEIYKILFDIGAITTAEIRQMEDMIS
jgi:HK97 family phage portal protein